MEREKKELERQEKLEKERQLIEEIERMQKEKQRQLELEKEAQRKSQLESKNNLNEIKEEQNENEERIKVRKVSRKESDLTYEDGNDKFVNLFKNKKMNKYGKSWKEKDEEYDYNNLTVKDQNSIISKLTESFQKGVGRPTKIKIYKCVVWKNTDPTIDEETIKKMLHRSGSQIFKRGGFVVKLPQKSSEK